MKLTMDQLEEIVNLVAGRVGSRYKEVFATPGLVRLLVQAGAPVLTNEKIPGSCWQTTVTVGNVAFTHLSVGSILP